MGVCNHTALEPYLWLSNRQEDWFAVQQGLLV